VVPNDPKNLRISS
jgi:hypothetical protein